MEPAVAIEGVQKRYGETVALAGLDLELAVGEIFTLIGPNGAGKTTLVRTLTGTVQPDAGRVSIGGAIPGAIDRERLGVLPQAFSPPGRLTGREIVAYYAGLYDDPLPVDDVLAAVGMAEDADRWYDHLSGGQQRRICVGTALVNDPDVLVLDEPTTGIDPAGAQQLWTLLRELGDGGTTILMTTHDMTEAGAISDRVGILADGSLVATGTPAALIGDYGGASRLVVDLRGDPSDHLPAEFPWDSHYEDGSLHVTDLPAERISAVLAELDDRGIEYTSVAWTEPTLRDVFLAVTDWEDEQRRPTRSTVPEAS